VDYDRDLIDMLSPQELFERFWELYESGDWEPQTRALIEEVLQPGDLFVDIGAWIGPVTLWALECGARVIAVEPDPMALPELRRCVPDSVEVWEGAVAVQSGTAGLRPNHDLDLGKSVSRLVADGGIQVRTWTLAEILGDRVPSLVKVDIEGYEMELLPAILPDLAAAEVSIQVALHGVLPEYDWFSGYRDVAIPEDPYGIVIARP
jgi:FkbM family methyltransferase